MNINVVKRNGNIEPFDILKIRKVIDYACKDLNVSSIKLEANLTNKFNNNMKTEYIQNELINTAKSLVSIEEPDWTIACGRLIIYNIQRNIYKRTKIDYNTNFKDVIYYMTRNGYYDRAIHNYYTDEELSSLTKYIKPENDDNNSIASALSLQTKYLIKNSLGPVELPQHNDLANSLFLNKLEKDNPNRMKEVVEEYKLISDKVISLATPFKSNLRKKDGNLSSCFIVEVDDNIESIMKVYKDIALISKNGGNKTTIGL